MHYLLLVTVLPFDIILLAFRYMSIDEVRAWIIPPDFDHTEAEARHLMEESDTDRDEKLSKQVNL